MKKTTLYVTGILAVSCLSGAMAETISLTGGLYGAGTWMNDPAAWSDGLAPHADADYIVDRNNTDKSNSALRFGVPGYSFGGRSLQFGVLGGFAPTMIFADQVCNFPWDGLKLARGSITSWINGGTATSVRLHKIQGQVSVLSEGEAQAYQIKSGKNYHSYMIESNLVGNANAYLKVNSTHTGFEFPLYFDGSDYLGTIAASGNPTMFRIGSRFNLNGLLHVSAENSTFAYESTAVKASVKNLSVAAPVTFFLNHASAFGTNCDSAVLQVTDSASYTGNGQMTVRHSNDGPMNWKQNTAGRSYMRFLTVPKTSSLTVNDFQPYYVSPSRQKYPVCDIIELEESAGTKTFALRRRPYLQFEGNTVTTAVDSELGRVFAWGTTSDDGIPYTDRRNWDFDFFTKANATMRYYTTPDSAETYQRVGGYYYFVAKDDGSGGNAVALLTKDADIGKVFFEGGCYIANGGGAANNGGILRGDVTLVKYGSSGAKVDFRFSTNNSDGRKMDIAATLHGDCGVRVTSSTGSGVLRLTGDNSDFKGFWLLDGARGQSEFRINNPTALGGALDAFRADALVLTNNIAFIPEGTMSLNEATRGITVKGTAAKIVVENDDCVTLGSQLTFDGTLVKDGSGTLALAGTSVVGAGASGVLQVENGLVKPLSSTALAGVTLACGTEGAFVYDVPEVGAMNFGATGLMDPILAAGTKFRFTVALDKRPKGVLSVPVCTLSSDKVAAFKSAFQFVRTTPNTGCRLIEKVVDGNRVTLIAEVGPVGFMVIFR